MLDSRLLRTDPEGVARNLARRGYALDVARFRALEERRKSLQVAADEVRAARNAHAKTVGKAKAEGRDIAPLLAQGEALAKKLESLDADLGRVQGEFDAVVLTLPNLLHDSVPEGRDETSNVVLRRWGEPADVANLICFLSSDLASYITGTMIDVSGGKFATQFPWMAHRPT